MKTTLISLNGYACTGKDTVASIVQSMVPEFENKKFADKLKQIASIMTGLPAIHFEDRDLKESQLSEGWGMTAREFLQKLGTDAIRTHLHNNAWVNALMSDYRAPKLSEYNPSKWIITDVRFPNEAQAIKERGGVVVRINRPGFGPVNGHQSETAMDGWDFDYILDNDGDMYRLKQKVENFLLWLKN